MKKQTVWMNMQSVWRSTIFHFIIITCIWVAAVLLVNPTGNFPLKDDWSYEMTVKRFLIEKTFHPPGWPAMTLISQTLWGVLVSLLFGLSFNTLRLSILFLSLLILFTIYLIIRELSDKHWHALIVALTLAFNPLFFSLSFTFMTEIPFILYATLSMLFFMRNLKYDSVKDIILGTCFSTMAILCRQIGFFVPMAFGLVLFLKKKRSFRSFILACLPTAIGLALSTAFQKWMETTGKLSQSYNLVIHEIIQRILHEPQLLIYSVPRSIFFTIQYSGLFLLPLLILFYPIQFKNKRFRLIVTFFLSLFFVFTMYLSFIKGHLMPLFTKFESNLIKEGLGPLTLNDTFIRHLTNLPALPNIVWIGLTLLSIMGGMLLLVCFASVLYRLGSIIKSIRNDESSALTIFFLLSSIIYLSPLAVSKIFFDRYLTPLFIPLSFLVVQTRTLSVFHPQRKIKWITAFLIGGFACFSILVTHDYMAWHRTRWEALDYLMNEKGIAPTQIDGGFEFNGLYLYSENYPVDETTSEKSWWWVQDDLYMVTFGEVPGYKEIRRYHYDRWMPRGEGQILILKRNEQPSIQKQ